MKVFRTSFASALLATLALALPTAAQAEPVIDTISPNGGTLGTVVTIDGSNFGDTKPKVFLTDKFTNKKTKFKVTAFSATSITAELKSAKAAGAYTLNVQPKGKDITPATGAFTILPVAIVGLDPDTAMPGDELDITATNVGNKKPKVKIGGKQAKVVDVVEGGVGEGSVDTITVQVPKSLANGAFDVEVVNKVSEDTSSNGLEIVGSAKKYGKHQFSALIDGQKYKVGGKLLGASGNSVIGVLLEASKGNSPNKAFVFSFPLPMKVPAEFSGPPADTALFSYIESTFQGGKPQIQTWTQDDFVLVYEGMSGGQIKGSFAGTMANGQDIKTVEGSFVSNFEEEPVTR